MDLQLDAYNYLKNQHLSVGNFLISKLHKSKIVNPCSAFSFKYLLRLNREFWKCFFEGFFIYEQGLTNADIRSKKVLKNFPALFSNI